MKMYANPLLEQSLTPRKAVAMERASLRTTAAGDRMHTSRWRSVPQDLVDVANADVIRFSAVTWGLGLPVMDGSVLINGVGRALPPGSGRVGPQDPVRCSWLCGQATDEGSH